jgi:hypothetical protein
VSRALAKVKDWPALDIASMYLLTWPQSRLREVLEAFREAANLGVDIQLKILQALPPLLQNYPDELHSTLLGEILLICAILQGSKMGVVNNTAAASTLVFELSKLGWVSRC